jgi:predicted nucleic acid-binding protein
MTDHQPTKPRVFIDADVLFAGAASPNQHSASLVVLRMAEITLIDAIASQQVITEVQRNLQTKIPRALPAFQLLVNRCLRIVLDPKPEELLSIQHAADWKDLPILAAAARENCAFLTTFNLRHFQPGLPGVKVLEPGDLVWQIRLLLVRM